MVLGWQKLPDKYRPPRWMWGLVTELEKHFKWMDSDIAKQADPNNRNSNHPDDDDDDVDEDLMKQLGRTR